MAKLLTRYHAQLTAQPALTKFSTGVVVFALGDIGCQYGVESVPLLEVDIVRTSRAAVFGGLFSLWLHGWWNFLERAGHRIAPVATRGTLLNASFKVFCDQTFSATLFNAGYIAAANAKPGATVGSVWGCVVAQTPSQMLLHWKFWPWFHLMNFVFIPLHYRVVAMNVVKVGWSGLLSHRAASAARR